LAFAPIIGDLKYINKASKLKKGITGELSIVDDASDAFKNADEAADGVADASKGTGKAVQNGAENIIDGIKIIDGKVGGKYL
jgi:hypothetical protein